MSDKMGVLETARANLGFVLSSVFSSSASPNQATPSPAPNAAAPSGPSSCEKLAAEVEQRGGQILAGQQRMAMKCGIGGV